MDAQIPERRIIRFGLFEADLESWQLRKDGVRLKVSGQPLDVLAMLLEHPGDLVTRDELRIRLWPSTVVDYEHSLNAAIKKLREVLGDSSDHPTYIETIPKRGYRFIAPVAAEIKAPRSVFAEASPPSELPPLTADPVSRRSRLAKPTTLAMAGLALAALVAASLVTRSGKPAVLDYVQLTNFPDSVSSPTVSPTGQMVAFLRGEGTFVVPGDLWVKMLPDGEPVQLTHDGVPKMSPVFSPDGSRIAYTVSDRWTWETWSVPVLGGGPQRWLHNASGLTWTGDQLLLFSEIDHGVHMKVVASQESGAGKRDVYQPLQDGMAHRSYLSPDGKWVLVAEMDVDWFPCRLLPFDGSSRGRQVGPSPARCTNAAWSPDGRWMYFSADTGAGFHIWRQRFPSGNPEQITFGATGEEGIAVAPDGKSLITSIGEEGSTVWFHDGAGERQLSSEGYAYVPSISPDGKKVYYLVRSTSSRTLINGELWSIALASSKRERVLPGFLITRYALSPDGRQVAFTQDEGEGRSSLWLASTEGSPPPRRLRSSDGLRPLFGPDGKIFFLRKKAELRYVYRMNQDGTGLERIVPDPVMHLQSLSPDGNWVVAWVTLDDRGTAGAVKAYPVRGGPPKSICTVCSVSGSFPIVTWSRDQKFFYFASHAVAAMRKGRTFVLPVPPGEVFPSLPIGGIHSDEDLYAMPPANVVEHTDVSPGAAPSMYSFSQTSTHRNLYKLQIP